MSTTPAPRPSDLTPSQTSALLRDTTPWLSCDECFDRMDAYAEAAVRAAHRDEAMHAHLRGCSACDEEAESLIELLSVSRDSGRPSV